MGQLVDLYNKSHKAQAKVTSSRRPTSCRSSAPPRGLGPAPDVSSIDLVYAPYFASAGALEDITDLANGRCRTRTR